MKIVVDLLGADSSEEDLLQSCIEFLEKNKEDEIIAIGSENLKNINKNYDSDRLKFIYTNEYISNYEHPVMAIRKKKNSSIVLGLNKLNEDADAFLSAGSTGALLAGGYFITGRIKGIKRAVLAVVVPSKQGGNLLVDSGANMDTTPEMLSQFALMGSIYCKSVLKRSNPRVGLLNVGSEDAKGDKRALETFEILSNNSNINFIGNIEARSILDIDCDVFVSDGFSGNLVLKAVEGTAKLLLSEIKQGALSSLRTKLGALLLKPVFKKILKDYSYDAHGAAPLLGVKKPIFKAHGNSSTKTFEIALSEVKKYVESNCLDQIKKYLENK